MYVVMVPKYRRKTMYGVVRREIPRQLCVRFGIELVAPTCSRRSGRPPSTTRPTSGASG